MVKNSVEETTAIPRNLVLTHMCMAIGQPTGQTKVTGNRFPKDELKPFWVKNNVFCPKI